ncbi:hypothetical protein MP228_012125 [Amoeboaphelidium protococcarum]|nr:hypothetical protein MP228_012125 [Amoeboaphelidium protococcarum]
MVVIRVLYVCIAAYALIVAALHLTYPRFSEYGKMNANDVQVAGNLTSHWQVAMNGWESVAVDLPDGVLLHYAYDQPVNMSIVDGPMYKKKIIFSHEESQGVQSAAWFNQWINQCFTNVTVEMSCKGSSQNPDGFATLILGYSALRCYLNQTMNNYTLNFHSQECDSFKNGGNFLNINIKNSEYLQKEVEASVAFSDVQGLELDIQVQFQVPKFYLISGHVCADRPCFIERDQSQYVSMVFQSQDQSAVLRKVGLTVQFSSIYRAFYILWQVFYFFMWAVFFVNVNPLVWLAYPDCGCLDPILIMLGMKKRTRYLHKRNQKVDMEALNLQV